MAAPDCRPGMPARPAPHAHSQGVKRLRLAALLACLAGSIQLARAAGDYARTYPPMTGDARLTGVALLADEKTPWAKADVELWWFGGTPEDKLPLAAASGSSAYWETQTDKQGRFALRKLPPGRYWLR